MENLDCVLESILFTVGNDINIEDIKNILKVDIEDINVAIDKLKIKYNDGNVIVLKRVENNISLVTNKKYYEYVKLFVDNNKRQNLSTSAIETLTIIAYNPKITKLQIENIRGVNSDFAVGRLLECGLIEEVGRLKLPGRPAIYSTTKDFLKNCDISSLEELPDFDKIKLVDEQLVFEEINEDNKG
ncbi:MAG: SMC-Scp complex subunit ScpB [Clostridia bacterium]